MSFWKKIKHGLRYLYNHFFIVDCAQRAASLSYATILSLVPAMMVSFWILSFIPTFHSAGEIFQSFILANFVADSANTIAQHLNNFMLQIQKLSVTNLLVLLIVAILMLYNIVHTFNSIWQVKMERHFALSFILYLFVLLITPLLLAALIVITSYVVSLPLIEELTNRVFIKSYLLFIFPYLFAFAVFTFLNWMLPSCHVPLRSAIWAGLLTTLLFEITKYGFGKYIAFFSDYYHLLYGALATIPIFLAWIYCSWVIILLGAVFCRAITVKFS